MSTQAERRLESKRIPVAKSVELLSMDGTCLAAGTTDNLSDAGLSAHFDTLPEMGSDLRLRLFWRPDQAPIDQKASLVWQASEAGAGMCVGFRLMEAQAEDGTILRAASGDGADSVSKSTGARRSAAEPSIHPPVLEQGGTVWLQKGGVAIRAAVTSIGDIGADNSVDLVLEITDPAFCDPQSVLNDYPLSPELQDFTLHPFRDAWGHARRYLGPVVNMLSYTASRAAYLLRRGIEMVKRYLDAKRTSA